MGSTATEADGSNSLIYKVGWLKMAGSYILLEVVAEV